MKSKSIQSAFDDFKKIIESGTFSSEYVHEDKKRRAMLNRALRSYNSFLSSHIYEDMDDERLFDVSSIDEEEVSDKQIIDRITDVIGFFYKLREKLLQTSSVFCKNGADYFNVIAKKYNLYYVKQDKRTERRID